jgi:hypothetical protein
VFTDSGTVVGVGPRTAVGRLTLDAAGNLLNGAATSSLDGAIANETFSGTYTVNPDCMGTISVDIFASGVELFAITGNIAFDNDMKHMRGIFTSVVEPNGTSLLGSLAGAADRGTVYRTAGPITAAPVLQSTLGTDCRFEQLSSNAPGAIAGHRTVLPVRGGVR